MHNDDDSPVGEPEPTARPLSGSVPAVGEPSEFARRAARAADTTTGSVGNLELADRLGLGAMGAVYRAVHATLQTNFAVKILHPQYSSNEEAVERFRLEAIACSRLRHENIVFVTDFGFEEGLGLYIAMEYLEGSSLGRILRREGRMTLGRMARVGEQVCSAMAAAHRLNIVHRDLKPDNVMILDDPNRRDFAKVLDFGIAKVRDQEARDLTSGAGLGTPRYMAPEQLMDHENVGSRTDIYALGCIFYAMLSSNPPFATGSDFEILNNHVRVAPKPIADHVPELEGKKLGALVMQMLEKKYDARPESMDEVRERLHEGILELMEAGVPGAEYEFQTVDDVASVRTGEFAAAPLSVHPIRMTQVIERIREAAPDSPSAALLAALPSVGALQGEVLCLALWGIIQQDVIDADIDSPLFEQTSDQLLLLMQAVLESHEGSRPSQTQHKIFRSLINLLELLPKERKKLIVRGLRPLSTNPLFPSDMLAGENTGSWSAFKSVITRDISLPSFGKKLDPEEVERRARRKKELTGMSLVDKLRQDVSLSTIKSVLGHDITHAGSGAIEPLDDDLDGDVED